MLLAVRQMHVLEYEQCKDSSQSCLETQDFRDVLREERTGDLATK